MKALVIDDHPIARRGLGLVLSECFEMERIVGVDRGAQALKVAPRLAPDLVLMDLQIPDHPRGAALCSALRAAVPAAKIVIVTAFARVGEIKQCLAASADGALLKDSSDGELTEGLKSVMAGKMAISPGLAQELASDLVGVLRGEENVVVHLTTREREALDLLAEGCSNREIAERLVLSEATVKDHVGALLRKLGATSRLHAVVRASEAGLL